MSDEQSLILIIGAADTGRAPMAAAILRRLLQGRDLDWSVASAGVVGHDDEPAQVEARNAITMMGLDLSQHQARSLRADLAASARLLLAIDSGVARVLREREPAASVISLGELADRRRDIPDPFRMQVGAWLNYAREIESMLSTGLDRLVELVEGRPGVPRQPEPPAPMLEPGSLAVLTPVTQPELSPRLVAVERCTRLLDLLIEMPDVVDWVGASRQIAAELPVLATPLDPEDLAQPYVALIQALLGMTVQTPTLGQANRLQAALTTLRGPVAAVDLTALSTDIAAYPGL
jgi:protein-tyrosine phosphatase